VTRSVEREVKLRVDSPEAARASIIAAGGVLVRPRRLQSDGILDNGASDLRSRRCALRVRVEPDRCFLTFKGPPLPSAVKLREELETSVGDPVVIFALLERLGFRVWFRYEKYREEYVLDDVLVAVDETPVGTFMEIEGSEDGIAAAALRLGHSPHHYVVDSYRALFVQYCIERGIEPGHMVFPR
jgi:adenylate cyclase class 2